ncbi:MAG: ribosome silencing factor [Chloroflexi bacterium CFX4]|nr:ribosome silencing factor [Chloroflexi bacterium CFX4]MDL1922193.1 ribosome silencing factor [Chloroflexi bacterium CFX3]
MTLETVDIARTIVDLIADRKGEDITLMDLRMVSVITDFFVIASANSDRQLNAIAEYVRDELKQKHQTAPLRIEGRGESGWILMDYGDVIVHLFSPTARAYYDLESLWREGQVLLRMQ